MAFRESDIVHEAGRYWVVRMGRCFGICRNDGTHATRIYLYSPTPDTPDRLRDAVTHCDHLAEEEN